MGRADDESHIPCPAVCAVSKELGQLVGGDLPALDAHGHDGSTLAHVGQDGLALLVQCLFYHGIRGVLLLDLFLRQLDDAEGCEGGKALLVLGHALGEIFCIQLAHTDQVDVLHCSFLFYRNDLKLSPLLLELPQSRLTPCQLPRRGSLWRNRILCNSTRGFAAMPKAPS